MNLVIGEHVDDVGFLIAVVKSLQMEHGLNPDNTFVFGVSNGGFMGYTLACQAPEVFSAVAPKSEIAPGDSDFQTRDI